MFSHIIAFMDYLNFEILGLTNVYQLLLIIHLIGLAIGAGAAFFSDFLFTNILKDKKIDKTEFRILKLASNVVWVGLFIMLLSGLAIFIGDFDRLIESSKFLAKVSILAVLIANGVVFHLYQIPMLKKYIGKDLSKNKHFLDKHAYPFFMGGAISGVSWVAALVLGALPYVDLSYIQIMMVYSAVLLVAVASSRILKKKMLA